MTDTAPDAMTLLEEAGAVLKGHFQYASGRHGDTYIEKFRLLEKPHVTETLCGQLADHFRPLAPELVVGPTTGGIPVGARDRQTARPVGQRLLRRAVRERRPIPGARIRHRTGTARTRRR